MLALSQLARPWLLNLAFFLCKGAQFEFSGCGVPAFLSWLYTTFLKILVEVMTSGLSQVCNLWFGVSKGILPVRLLAQEIIMAVNYCGHQVEQRFGWAVPAYHEKEGAALILEHASLACCMTGDDDDDGRFGVQNLGSLRGKGDVCEELRKRKIDVCCLNEVRWRGLGARMLWMKGRRYISCGGLETEMELVVWELW